jgi:hypothetical protein
VLGQDIQKDVHCLLRVASDDGLFHPMVVQVMQQINETRMQFALFGTCRSVQKMMMKGK